MPKIFMSYKRGTPQVGPLMDQLKEAGYETWYDVDDIPADSPDWQASIDKGIAACDGLIVCITPDAYKSKYIRYEVDQAQKRVKPIFAVLLVKVSSLTEALRDLGLPERQQLEDFTNERDWREIFNKLIKDMYDNKVIQVAFEKEKRQRQKDHHIDNSLVNLTIYINNEMEAGSTWVPDKLTTFKDLSSIFRERPEFPGFVLVGPPGAGKSALMYQLEGDNPLIHRPFYVRLSEFSPHEDPREWLTKKRSLHNPSATKSLAQYIKGGQLLVILDGLNEIPLTPTVSQFAILQKWRNFATEIAGDGNRFLFPPDDLLKEPSLITER